MKKVCVLKGGISEEREISLKSGEFVEKGLKKAEYEVFNIDTKERNFLGQLIKESPDVVFIALHGPYGEDGTVQGLMEMIGIPYTGSGVLASALAMDKIYSKAIFASQGFSVPRFQIVKRNEEINLEISPPIIVKPPKLGSTLGVSLIKDISYLKDALNVAFQYDSSCAILEEYIRGKEITVGIIDNPQPCALPIVEILPKRNLYDYKAKYTKGFCEYIVPASLGKKEYLKAEEIALRAYQALGCRDFARVDMIVRKDTVFLLEVNTIPGMTEGSLFPRAARAAGLTFSELVDKIVKAALKRRGKIAHS